MPLAYVAIPIALVAAVAVTVILVEVLPQLVHDRDSPAERRRRDEMIKRRRVRALIPIENETEGTNQGYTMTTTENWGYEVRKRRGGGRGHVEAAQPGSMDPLNRGSAEVVPMRGFSKSITTTTEDKIESSRHVVANVFDFGDDLLSLSSSSSSAASLMIPLGPVQCSSSSESRPRVVSVEPTTTSTTTTTLFEPSPILDMTSTVVGVDKDRGTSTAAIRDEDDDHHRDDKVFGGSGATLMSRTSRPMSRSSSCAHSSTSSLVVVDDDDDDVVTDLEPESSWPQLISNADALDGDDDEEDVRMDMEGWYRLSDDEENDEGEERAVEGDKAMREWEQVELAGCR